MITLILAAALAATPASADAPNKGSARVCHKISYLGSRLNSQTICKSKAEWDQIQWEHDHEVMEAQAKNRTMKSN